VRRPALSSAASALRCLSEDLAQEERESDKKARIVGPEILVVQQVI
jgi:hypothetical protein